MQTNYFTKKINVPAIVTSAGIVIPAQDERKAWNIQNVGSNPIFVCLGSTASSTVFHFVIKGGTGDSDGLGGSVGQNSGLIYSGDISIAGTTPKVVVMES